MEVAPEQQQMKEELEQVLPYIHTYIHTHTHTINDNKVGQQLMHLLLLLLLALLLLEVGRNLMHLEMFVQRDSNLRDDQLENLNNKVSRHDQAIARLDRLVDYTVSRVGD